jgi:hypothetical protein
VSQFPGIVTRGFLALDCISSKIARYNHRNIERRGTVDDSAMTGSIATGDGATAHADTALENMGYKSELPRSLSMMSILGL